MTRVWANGQRYEENGNNHENGYNSELSETDFNTTEAVEGHSDDKAEGFDEKLHYLNGNEKNFQHMTNGGHINDEIDAEKSEVGDTFLGIHWDKGLENELAEQSKMMLKMIYFFQVLPFYILQFTSGMALGKNDSLCKIENVIQNKLDIVRYLFWKTFYLSSMIYFSATQSEEQRTSKNAQN